MRCTACAAEAAPGARFCATCGARLVGELQTTQPASPPATQTAHQPTQSAQSSWGSVHHAQASNGQPVHLQVNVNLPPAARRHLDDDQPRELARRPGVFCQSCGQRTMPMPYFARGLNVAKAAVLFPFSVFGPLLLFLIRKDRVVCSNCKALLPGEVNIPLLETFSAAPASLERGLSKQDGQALDAREAEKQLVNEEIEHLERRSRRRASKAWSYGLTAGLLAGAGGLVAANGGPEVLFFGLSGLTGIGAVSNGRRSKQDGIAAQMKRQRQRVLELLGLARQHGGRLNVTLVASHMHLDFREAETLLDSMVDGRRVDVQVDDQGRVNYVFPELSP